MQALRTNAHKASGDLTSAGERIAAVDAVADPERICQSDLEVLQCIALVEALA
jgi:hypothetical protein